MGKKGARGRSSKEEEDVESTAPSCSHIRKGIGKNIMNRSSDLGWTVCQDCKERDGEASPQGSAPNATEDPPQIWICLKCGHRGCGRFTESQHALKHYETPRSDLHCLVLSVDSWSVWCYICDEEVPYSGTGLLARLVNGIKKQTPSAPRKRSPRRKAGTEGSVGNGERVKEENKENRKVNTKGDVVRPTKPSSADRGAAVPVKGLGNLGNTCFFNAVIQNLSQTRLLRQILDAATREESGLRLAPAASSSDLGPIEVRLDRPGPLTLAMCRLLDEIRESEKGVVTPRDLFTQVCKKAARFKGYQQQDSQELLRYLLDGMRAEEIQRVTAGISEALKRSGTSADADQSKALIQEYGKNGLAKNFVDHVFGGELTSTIMCQRCKTVSSVTEMFLDLSLPVSDEAYRKKTQKTGDSSQEGWYLPPAPSGNYQQKKAKKHGKKDAKNQRRQQPQEGKAALVGPASGGPAESTPADRPDPVEGASDAVRPPGPSAGMPVPGEEPDVGGEDLAAGDDPARRECSVRSCLVQFTEVETLTRDNSLLCTACSAGARENVYTDGLKQMLISSPPPVLTLHLKRFRRIGRSVSKVNRHVRFPQILDLAPFCAFECKDVPEGVSRLPYGLYGIVEHSGTMRSGHYTAYVKASRLPRRAPDGPSAPGEALRPTQGSWFHVSDTSVRPVSESEAQGSQAYILFYERMPL